MHDSVVAGQRADRQLVAFDPDVVELGQTIGIDDRLRREQTQIEHRDQALTAGEHLGLLAMPGQSGERGVQRSRTFVCEC
jgi:hypothetical protein